MSVGQSMRQVNHVLQFGQMAMYYTSTCQKGDIMLHDNLGFKSRPSWLDWHKGGLWCHTMENI